MKKILWFLLFMGIFLAEGISQSSERITELIDNTSITNGQASYLAASYLGLIQEDDSDAEAFRQLVNLNYFSSADDENALIDYSTLSYVYAKALKLKGGLFYTLLPSKRYAFNELKAKGIIPSDCDPSDKVSGRNSIAVFTLCMELKEGAE